MATQRIGGVLKRNWNLDAKIGLFCLRIAPLGLTILPDEPHGRGKGAITLHFSSKRVIVIQAKVGPVGMFYLSQKARVGQGLDTLCHTHLFSIERSQKHCTRSTQAAA